MNKLDVDIARLVFDIERKEREAIELEMLRISLLSDYDLDIEAATHIDKSIRAMAKEEVETRKKRNSFIGKLIHFFK